MTGSSERLIGRPFVEGGKDNLRGDSLRRLLKALEQKKVKERFDSKWAMHRNGKGYRNFGCINYLTQQNTDIGVHPILSKNLGMDELKWRLKSLDGLSTLFVGGRFEEDEELSVNQGLAILEVESRAIYGKKICMKTKHMIHFTFAFQELLKIVMIL